HSDVPQQLSFAGTISGGPPAPLTPTLLNGFTSVSGQVNYQGTWSVSTLSPVTSTDSALFTLLYSGTNAPTFKSATGTYDLSNRTVLQHWVGLEAEYS